MPENLQLLSREREAELQREAIELQVKQQKLAALADEYHQVIRVAADELGRKRIAGDIGIDLSTLSNQLSCEPGRGFPQPRLLLYLRERSADLRAWGAEHAVSSIDDAQVISEIEREILPELGKRDAQKVLAILRRRRSAR